MAINALTASSRAYAVAAAPPAYNEGSTTSQPATAAKTDTVQLSSAALALSLEAAGDSSEEIASIMGLDITTVDDYLGILPSITEAATPPTTQVAATSTNTVAITPYTTPLAINTSTFSVTA